MSVVYPKRSDGYSELCLFDTSTYPSGWAAKGATMYPDKDHQRINNHQVKQGKFAGGSGSESPASYPKKVQQTKFASVRKQV